MSKLHKTFTGNKVPRLTKFLFPFSGIFRDACYALVGSFLLQYALNSGVLSADGDAFKAQYAVITVAMVIALIWDGINDPIMGFIVEKVHLPWGKFKPWILIGAIGNAIAVVCMFLIRPTNADGTANGWAFVGVMIAFYFLWDLFFTMNDIGYWSMLPSLTNDDKERASITSRMTICASIGGFLMTAACMLLPTMFSNVSSARMYMYLAIGTAVLFLLSQTLVFFLCQEKERGQEQEEASENSSLLDLFKVVGKNDQVRVSVIAMFLYYLASGVLTGGIGLNYFYLSLGYGSGRGGLVSAIISVMYVIGMVASQALYPVLAKKMPKKKILLISFIIQLVGFAGFLICCVPLFGDHPIAYNPAVGEDFSAMDFGWALGGTMFLYYIFPLIFFFGMGMMYMVIMVMLQDSIDYNEYKFGERKESIISAWRPLDVKLSSALLRVFQIVIFSIAGLLTAVNEISNAERAHDIWINTEHAPGEIDPFKNTIAEIQAGITTDSLRIAGVLIVIVLVLAVVAAWALLQFGYKIDEETHQNIVAELETRHASDGAPQEALEAAGDAGEGKE
ncbi:MAG: MFS transporter [Bacilli bacterium]|nr:MFS transporter [Bacilli bacterium]